MIKIANQFSTDIPDEDPKKATLRKVAFLKLDEVRGLKEDLLPVVLGAFVDGGDDLDGLACFGSAG